MKIVKKILVCLIILLIIILFKLFFSYFINEIIKLNYKNNSYEDHLIKVLYFVNFPESYIAYYNHGTILYQMGEYNDAANKFKEALDHNPPKSKVCQIRINYALSIVGTVNKDDECDVINSKLDNAKNILYGDDCAGEGEKSGISLDADKLEEEISEKQSNTCSGSESDSDEGDEEEQEENNDDSDLEEKIREQQSDSRTSRNDEYDEIEGYGDYSYYNGKTW